MTYTFIKKGFVLVEVLISVLLLSVVTVSVLKILSTQKRINHLEQKRTAFLNYATLLINNHNIGFINQTKSLYSIIRDRYIIKNDRLIKIVKDIKISYRQNYYSTISLERNGKKGTLIVDKIVLTNKDGTMTIFTVQK